ncbi:hypothetical protein BU25DRAFT_340748 [Macroventuria anomochaeta]|uniref:Uncharacterized protein n=1 Tax=Macroventuria anomochaeta TaxID=301207 RepID=A0ACB6S3J0_9PLEO|nr:uncharacterized protein BU25DRAFT_340748 [Macroventuria anomochaeta]KAF2627959.1 hypothetical protein BU25DRAFT_340748 [Macroventuria anomochaeta]
MTEYDDYGVPVGAYQEPDSFTGQTYRTARAFLIYSVRPFVEKRVTQGRWKRLFSLANALVAIWWVVVYWGERGAFNGAVGSCNWDAWENWEEGASPHRLVFVADPQLVDPHTYPGRPWPLNPLTMKYTDQYMRRAYSRIQTELYPDTVFFLGDLFDGGREWSTRTTKSPEKQYQQYGDSYWMNEYRRFGSIFLDHWGDGGLQPRPGQPGRKFVSSLPGNHDLGFAKGVQIGVRDRFHAYFGDGNRIDVLGNHTFVSIDSVSLSALGVPSSQELEEVWRPTVDFLSGAKQQKRKLIQRELRVQRGLRPYPGFPHYEIESQDFPKATLPHADDEVTEFPTILLTHVPLYRAPGTPCGPLREHWPPSPPPAGQPSPLEHDERNAISVSGGYQYQNVLNKEISADIASKIGDIRYAFSGDDHDYCELVHRGYASGGGGIREVTVKSISWAMGVRHPGFVMVSLWNPVDAHGKPVKGDMGRTVQTHLCLLPDQLGVFFRYAGLFALTLVLLSGRAALVAGNALPQQPLTSEDPILPMANIPSGAEAEKSALAQQRFGADDYTHSSNSSTSSNANGNLQVRNAQARTRTASPANGYGLPMPMPHQQNTTYSHPLVQHAGYYGDEDSKKDVKTYGSVSTKSKARKKGFALFRQELKSSLGKVMICGLGWYFWLIWHG